MMQGKKELRRCGREIIFFHVDVLLLQSTGASIFLYLLPTVSSQSGFVYLTALTPLITILHTPQTVDTWSCPIN